MKIRWDLILIFFLVAVFIGGCSSLKAVPTPTSVRTYAPTTVPTVIPTPTKMTTPTDTLVPTPAPVYTELGVRTNQIPNVLGWGVVTCDSSQTKEDLDHGIFLYRKDVPEFFCGFVGYSSEPVPEVLPQFMLSLFDVELQSPPEKDGIRYTLMQTSTTFYPSPSTYHANEILRFLNSPFTIEELRKMPRYTVIVRLWPLTQEEVALLPRMDRLIRP